VDSDNDSKRYSSDDDEDTFKPKDTLIEPEKPKTVPEPGTSVEEWKCTFCSRADPSIPMIGCDSCDSWYHWSCVGIVSEPRKEEVWICSDCRRVKPLKKKKKDLDVKETFTSTSSSTRPGKSSIKTGPKFKTGSGVSGVKVSSLTKVSTTTTSASSSLSLSSNKPESVGTKEDASVHPSIDSSRRTSLGGEGSSQGWMCASCKTW